MTVFFSIITACNEVQQKYTSPSPPQKKKQTGTNPQFRNFLPSPYPGPRAFSTPFTGGKQHENTIILLLQLIILNYQQMQKKKKMK